MIFTIILIAGNSTRFDKKLSKNLLLLNNKPLFFYALETCQKNKNIDQIILVVNKNEKPKIFSYLNENNNKKTNIILGSDKSRFESLKLGVNFIKNNFKINKNDIIITLDGDRPLVSNELINKSVNVALKYGVCNTIQNIYDSIGKLNNKTFNYIDRNNLFTVQTPQTFKYKIWKQKHNIKGTDLFTSLDYQLNKNNLIEGNFFNIKITTKKDLDILKKIIKN